MAKCCICSTEFAEHLPPGSFDGYKINCPKCGRYDASGSSYRMYLDKLNAIQRANISGWIRNRPNPPTLLTTALFEQLKLLQTPTVAEKAHLLFNYLCKKYPVAGTILDELEKFSTMVGNSEETRKILFGIYGNIAGRCSIINEAELEYIIINYLCDEERFLEVDQGHYYVTPKGWHQFEVYPFSTSETAFVAMSFKNEFDSHYMNVIKTAIEKAGWTALRIKEERHNNYITNEIVSGIKQSKFMIADFTDNCEGAYFEAGLARGLGLPVIHMVHEDYLTEGSGKKVHFDTLQIYHLPWKTGDDANISEKLYHHIVATVGIGPVAVR
jgi:hypothetical protein